METEPVTDVHNDLPVDLPAHKAALTPPTSEDMDKRDGSSSELSDFELDDDDIGEIEPDHYYEGGKVPVFKPTMDQFRSFKKFIDKIDKYGMRSGIVKVIAPQEWRASLPALDEAVKTIKVKNPIMQEFHGVHGTYTQANIEKQRSYNLPEWKALTEETNHQPPLKRGERRKEPPTRTRSTRNQTSTPSASDAAKRKPGRPRKRPVAEAKEESSETDAHRQVPPTPTSPDTKPTRTTKVVNSIEPDEADDEDASPSKPRGRQPKSKSISSRRMNNRRDVANVIDEAAFKDFDYHLANVEEFTDERCRELEENYWKTLNYGTPMYGADMPGSLFDESTTSWNVAKLENLLDVLGTKVPGVNTAYLYLGMWKATFAWHLEDVDLYSINYIHFGAPKQWYSISQEDARRFEAAMKSIWPTDAKSCDQFLRHKTYLISPEKLKKDFNIKVNKLVHREGEFVITYPYGYHSGFNLGYNCAESVNFATEAWLNYGRIAKKCDCEADSVWVDVGEIERKLRGEPTPEFYEVTDDEEDEDDDLHHDLPSPPASVKAKAPTRKRKRDATGKDAVQQKAKRLKIRVKAPVREPCILCPNDISFDVLLPTDNGYKAHRLCALYTPETYLVTKDGIETVCNIAHIDKARLDLKCNFCRSKRGACFQCSSKKCTRAFHATCAAAAGVQIDTGPVPTWDEDGTEYVCEGYDFRCRFHRAKRPKNADSDTLEDNKLIKDYAKDLKVKDVVQAQYLQGDVFAGVVVENRPSEMSVVIDVLPEGDRVEVEWKWLLVLDPADSLRPKPSPNAKPLPEHLTSNHKSLNASNRVDGPPEMDEPFHDPNAGQKWAEFNTCTAEEVRNPNQAKIDLSKPEQLWHYLGKTSTEAKAQYTEDPAKPRHNLKSNFLDTVKPAPRPPAPGERRSYPASYPTGVNVHALNGAMAAQRQQMQPQYQRPYQYKPKSETPPAWDPRASAMQYGTYVPPRQPALYAPMSPPPQYASGSPTTSRPSSSHTPYQPPQYSPPPRPSSQDWSHAGYPYQQRSYTQTQHAIDPRLEQQQPPRSQGPYHLQYQPQQPQSSQAPRTSHYPTYRAPQQQQHPLQRVAPVANMMGSARSPPSLSQSMPYKGPTLSNSDYIAFIQKYPYLRNSYLRRPKKYQSPYAPGGGFTVDYIPILPTSRPSSYGSSGSSSSSSSSHASAAAPPLPPRATALPAMQYQTPQQFQAQVSQAGGSPWGQGGMTKFEQLIKQLGNTPAPPLAMSSSRTYYQGAAGPAMRTPPMTVAGGQQGKDLGGADYMSAMRGDVTPLADVAGWRSPMAPEYSPLSDVGGSARVAVPGQEGWRGMV